MTNEKTIDLLRRMQEPEVYEPPITEEAFEALEMAIRALGTDTNVGTKDVPDINVGDMISRQAAIDALCAVCGKACDKSKFVYNAPQDEQVILCPEHYCLCTLPSAQPENIRCAECKWFQCNMRQDGYLPKGVDEFECRHWCGYCDPTDFCSYAERRTNG